MSTTAEQMTNQSLRERFHLPESKIASISQVIAMAIEDGGIYFIGMTQELLTGRTRLI